MKFVKKNPSGGQEREEGRDKEKRGDWIKRGMSNRGGRIRREEGWVGGEMEREGAGGGNVLEDEVHSKLNEIVSSHFNFLLFFFFFPYLFCYSLLPPPPKILLCLPSSSSSSSSLSHLLLFYLWVLIPLPLSFWIFSPLSSFLSFPSQNFPPSPPSSLVFFFLVVCFSFHSRFVLFFRFLLRHHILQITPASN